MNEIIRRRRRRRSDERNMEISSDSLVPNTNPDDDINDVSSQSESIRPSLASNSNSINSIRTDLLEDEYYSELADFDYSDDTHNWSNENQLISDEYWHFLGRYE